VIAPFRRQSMKNDAATNLTPREEEILTLLAKGFVSKEIAAQLGVSYEMVRFPHWRFPPQLRDCDDGNAIVV
jgi:DNA-binding NarL/FixJ family response regulator